MDRLEVERLALKEIISDRMSIRESISKYVSLLSDGEISMAIARLRNILKYIYRIGYRINSVISCSYKDNEDLYALLFVMYREIKQNITSLEFDSLVSRASELTSSFETEISEERMREILVELRNKNEIDRDLDNSKLISMLSNVPEFIVRRFIDKYGVEKASSVFRALEKDSVNYVSVNIRKIDLDSFKREYTGKYEQVSDNIFKYIGKEPLRKQVEYKIGRVSQVPYGYIKLLEDIESFYKCNSLYIDEECKFDIGALLKLKLDENEGKLSSYYGEKTYEVKARNNYDRVGAKNVDINADKLNLLITYHAYKNFDLVVLNERSSSIGLMKRNKIEGMSLTKEEIKNHRKRETYDLFEASKYVSLGGDLVYFVNSFLDEETKDVINRFLRDNVDFSLIEERVIYPDDECDSDSCYYAIMRRG